MKTNRSKLMLRLLLCSCFWVHGQLGFSQFLHSCGTFIKPVSKKNAQYQSLATDRFGNKYSVEDANLFGKGYEKSLPCSGNGIFEINLVGNFTMDEENTICEVFDYLENGVAIFAPPNSLKVRLDIKKTNENIPTGAFGVASAYYNSFGCGIQNSLVWEKIVAGNVYSPAISPGGADGFILLNQDVSWYTSADDTPSTNTPVCPMVDLFSVVLHEAMHVLGFASLISDDGSPVGGNFYSNWDQFLNVSPNTPLISNQGSTGGCCDYYVYNSSVSPPLDLMDNNCDLIFKASSNYPLNTEVHGNASNSLSHLHVGTGCSNPAYVMSPTFDCGLEREELTADELAILSQLGVRGDLPVNCKLVANDDYNIVATQVNPSAQFKIQISELLNNDIILTGTVLEIIDDCGDQNELNATTSASEIIFPYGTQPGPYVLCYSISNNTSGGCSNDCDQASFTFIIPQLVDPLPALSAQSCDGDHFGYGNFNMFYPFNDNGGNQPYFGRLGIQGCPLNTGGENTPDIQWINQDKYCVHIIHTTSQREAIYLPLHPGVPPGCKAVIKFKGSSQNNGGDPNTAKANLFFFGSQSNPCDLGLLPDCYSSPSNSNCTGGGYYFMNESGAPLLLSNYSNITTNPPGGYCQYGVDVLCNSTTPPWPLPSNFNCDPAYLCQFSEIEGTLMPYAVNWTNTTIETINFITISLNSSNQQAAKALLDDIEVYVDCQNTIMITPNVVTPEVCNDGMVQIDYEICLESGIAATFEFEPTIGPLGVNYTIMGEFEDLPLSITLDPSNPCQTVTLFVDLHPTPFALSQLEIQLNMLTDNTCVQGNNIIEVDLNNDDYTDPDAGFSVIDDGCEVVFTSDDPSGYHSWDFNDGADVVPNVTETSYTFLTNGPHTVKHTVSNACGTVTEEAVFTLNCNNPSFVCECNTGYNLSSNTQPFYLSGIQNLPSEITGGCIAIAGQLIVDEDWKLDGVTIQMQPGSEIVTSGDSDVLFEVYNSTIESCQKMWKGITIDVSPTTGESAELKFKDNYIRDAQFAIRSKGKTKLLIANNHFERDFVGLFFESNGASPLITDKIKGNYFTTTSTPLKMPYDGQSPDPGTNMFAGIYVKATPFLTVGDPASSIGINTFSNLRNGIVAESSRINVYYTNISDIKGITSSNASLWDLKGIGIYLKDCKKSALLANTIGNSDNSRTGILALGSSASIRSNIISTKKQGIVYRDAINQDCTIEDNDISHCQYGISVANCTPASKLYIDINEIETSIGGGKAISVDNSYPTLTSNARIAENIITLQNTGLGISLNNSTKWKISDNDITVNGASSSIFSKDAAIKLEDSYNNQLWRNTVAGPGSTLGEFRGIFAYNSPDVLYCCNDLDETKYGLRFEGDCAGTTTIGTTQLRNHINGLYYDPSGVTGEQEYTGNEWNVNCSGYDAYHGGGLTGASFSQFTVDIAQAPYDANPPLGSGGWFTISTGTERTCQNWATCDEEEWLLPDVNDNDVRVANGELEDLASGEVVQWLSEQRLYAKLRRDTQLLQGNALMQSFKQTQDTADIGQLHDTGESVAKLWNFSQQTNSTVQSQTHYIDSLSIIADSIISALPGERQIDNDALVQALNNTLTSLDGVMTAYDTTIQAFKQSRLATIPSLIAAYDNMSFSFSPASNEQAVNVLQLDYWQNDTLTINQIAALYAIAIECPLDGGNAVFHARGLYETVTGTRKQWEYVEGCYGVNGRYSEGGAEFLSNDNQSEGILMYPNPTNGELTVRLIGQEGASGNLSVFDLSGKCHVQKQPVAFGDNRIELDKLPSGLHFVIVKTKEGQVFRQKLVIFK